MTTVTPLGNKIAVRKIEQAPRSNILHLTDTPDVYQSVEVLAVGPEARDVSPGFHVFANIGTALDFDGVYVIPEKAVLAITYSP